MVLHTVAVDSAHWFTASSALIYHRAGKGHIKIHALSINPGEIEISHNKLFTIIEWLDDVSHIWTNDGAAATLDPRPTRMLRLVEFCNLVTLIEESWHQAPLSPALQ
jgi:hypothetical protein